MMATPPIDKVIKKFESKNNTKIKDVPPNELALLFHNEQMKRSDKIDKTIIDLNKWCHETYEREIQVKHKAISKITNRITAHDEIIEGIVDKLPEKGWCEKVDTALFPDLPDLPLAYKANMMWNDWRWIKRIFWIMIVVGGATVINLIIQVVG